MADFLERKRTTENAGNDESKSPRQNAGAEKTRARWLVAADAR